MRIARWGLMPILVSTLWLGWLGLLLWPTPGFWPAVPVLLFAWGFTLAFYRMPRRRQQGPARCLIAPADGVIADIETVDEPDWLGEPCLRIGIFMSVFDVHVNYAPLDGRVAWKRYQPGCWLDARHPDVSHANEAMELGLVIDPAVCPQGRMLVRQISGLIARRIVCPVAIDDALQRGACFGMIRFGSRVEVWLPRALAGETLVTPGARVRGGETGLVTLADPERAS